MFQVLNVRNIVITEKNRFYWVLRKEKEAEVILFLSIQICYSWEITNKGDFKKEDRPKAFCH